MDSLDQESMIQGNIHCQIPIEPPQINDTFWIPYDEDNVFEIFFPNVSKQKIFIKLFTVYL